MKKPQDTRCDCHVIHSDIVRMVAAQMPENELFYRLAGLYKPFSDATRLRILSALSCHEMCVCDLAVLLSMTKSAISHQLKTLRLARLVKYHKIGKVVYYSLADRHVRDIFEKGMAHVTE